MDTIVAVAAGIAIGAATGLLPGLHVNLIAALALLLPMGAEASLGVVAIGVVHTFITILPSTYLGMPDEGALSVLPAHRMRLDGMARQAVQISLHSSMLAVIAVLLLIVPYHWVVARPAVLPFLELVAPVVLVAVPVWLIARDHRPWPASIIAGSAAGLGWLAFDWPVAGWLPGAATPLLPLLSGLFGIPTLLWAMRRRQTGVPQTAAESRVPRGTYGAGMRGLTAAMFTAVLPGLTAAVATSMAMPATRQEPGRVLATLSAVNTAHLCLAMAVLWMTGRTRSGLAAAWADQNRVLPWTWMPPPDLLAVLTTFLVAGACAVVITPLIEPWYERFLARLRPGRAEAVTLVLVLALVAVTTGWTGVLLFAAAIFIGSLPLIVGVRRVHLAAALSVPIALKLAGL